MLKIVSEYDQEMPQSQTADNPMAPRKSPSTITRHQEDKQSNQLSLPHQDDFNTRMDNKLNLLSLIFLLILKIRNPLSFVISIINLFVVLLLTITN